MNLFLRRFLLTAMLLFLGAFVAPSAWAGGDVDVFPSPTATPTQHIQALSSPPNYFGDNPSQSDIKNKLITAGQKYRIPPQILFGIAFQESGWRQFRDDRRTTYHLESDGRVGVGIMQITVPPSASDYQQLCTDINYNIDRGASMLIDKWNQTPVIGDGYLSNGHEKLENWYYAIWAYNGWTCPNYYPETVLGHVANGRGLWTPVSVSIPNISSCPPGKIQYTPSPVHIDANFDGEIDGAPPGNPSSSSSFDGFDFPFGNRINTNGWNDANPFEAYCGGGACGGSLGPYHPGEDWNAGSSTAGQPVYAAGSGTVILSKPINLAGRGNLVVIKHDTSFGIRYTAYLHVTGITVSVGSQVQRGQQIAYIYNMSTGPHLHFEMRSTIDTSSLYPHDDGYGYYYTKSACDGDGFLSPTNEINAHRPSNGGGGGTGNNVTTLVKETDAASADGQPGFFRHGTASYWKDATDTGQDGHMLYVYINGNNINNIGDWRANLPSGQRYEVFAWIPRLHATTRNAVYEIYHADGRTDVAINQYNYSDQWVSLGTYRFVAGFSGLVRLTDKTGESYVNTSSPTLGFDSVKWEPRGFAVGQGSSRQQLFVDSYIRNGSAGNVGTPVNATHWWGNRPIVIQDFQGGAFGPCAIIDDEPKNLGAWVIRGAEWSKFIDLGGPDGPQGPPRSDEGVATASPQGTTGAVQTFERGHIHASPLGVFFTINQIDGKFVSLGGSGSALGFPTSDESQINSSISGNPGWTNTFEGGRIIHCNELGTFSVTGGINSRYIANNIWNGALGFPVKDRQDCGASPQSTTGQQQNFEGGSIYESRYGDFAVTSAIFSKYAEANKPWSGGTGSPLGFPTTEIAGTLSSPQGTTGVGQGYEGGNIFSSAKGTFVCYGAIRDKYANKGNEGGVLGYPVSDPYPFLGGTRQDFEGGSLTDGASISIQLDQSTLVGGSNATGMVRLGGAAPAGGVSINVSSSDLSVTGSAVVVVPSGQISAPFSISTTSVSISKKVFISAVVADLNVGAPLTVTPPSTPSGVWTASDLSVGSDNLPRLLWKRPDGAFSLWTVNADTSISSTPLYGPIPNWGANAITLDGSNRLRLLLNNTGGQASVWNFSSMTNFGSTPAYGAYSGWTCREVASGSNGLTRLLWTRSDGAFSLWTVGADNSTASTPMYGPFSGWSARAISVGGDGRTRILLGNQSGQMSVWTVNGDGSFGSTSAYGPCSGWACTDIAVGSDNQTRVLWTSTNGQFSIWTLRADGNFSSTPAFGPIPFWSASKIGVSNTGGDGLTRVLLTRTTGEATVWTIYSDGTFSSTPAYGPIAATVGAGAQASAPLGSEKSALVVSRNVLDLSGVSRQNAQMRVSAAPATPAATIVLSVTGTVSSQSAQPSHFHVLVNDRSVVVQKVELASNRVVLRLPPGSLRDGDVVKIWFDLLNAQGKASCGLVAPFRAQGATASSSTS